MQPAQDRVQANAMRMARFVRHADAAEARGDARDALRVMQAFATMPDGSPLWRPVRVQTLRQLTEHPGELPGWAVSRWLVAQATRPPLTGGSRAAVSRALEVAVRARGGLLALPGTDSIDRRCKVMDHDWLFRQLFLHEYGALRRFLDETAAPDLVGRADRIREWADAPIRALRLLASEPAPTWVDLATGERVEPMDLGAALCVEDGECVLARLVRVEGGLMFEGSPLAVPDEVAESVAGDPDGWVAHLEEACRRHGAIPRRDGSTDGIIVAGIHDHPVLTDVPRELWRHFLADGDDPVRPDAGEEAIADEACRVVLLAGLAGAAGAAPPYPLRAAASAALVEPGARALLHQHLTPVTRGIVLDLAPHVSGPAAAVLASLG